MKEDLVSLIKKWHGGVVFGAASALARAIGVSPNTVSSWMRGRLPISERKIHIVAKTLGVTVGQLADAVNANMAPSHEGKRDRVVYVGDELFGLLKKKKESVGFPGSMDLFVESLLLAHATQTEKEPIRSVGVIAKQKTKQKSHTQHENHQEALKRNVA